MRNYRKPVWQTIGLGAVAGIRASVAPAIAGHYYNGGYNPPLSFPLINFMRSPVTSMATSLLTMAEDNHARLINPPEKLQLSHLAAHVASGAFAGAAIFKKNRQNIFQGMFLGGAAALVTSVASFYLRKYANEHPEVTQHFAGAFEDAFAVGSGVSIVKKY